MKITDNHIDITGRAGKVKEGRDTNLTGFLTGEIIEGVVTETDKGNASVIRLSKGNEEREVRMPEGVVKNTYAGDVRRFEVVESGADRLVLKDLGSVAGTGTAQGICFMDVDRGLPRMVEDFSETMGDKEKEDEDPIRRLSDEDYSELHNEGFSIEEFKAERLAKAIERVKSGREARREDVEVIKDSLKKERQDIIRTALSSFLDAKGSSDALTLLTEAMLREADLPVTETGVSEIAGAVNMAMSASNLGSDPYAYLIGNELDPTAANVYKAVFAGRVRKTPVSEKAFAEIRSDIENVVKESAAQAESLPNGLISSKPDSSDARWMLEYDIPVTSDNLIYKKELEKLTSDCAEEKKSAGQGDGNGKEFAGSFLVRTIEAAIDAIYRGEKAEDALLIDPDKAKRQQLSEDLMPAIRDVNERLSRENARLSLTLSSAVTLAGRGIRIDTQEIEAVIDGLKNLEKEMYAALYDEVDAGAVSERSAGANAMNAADPTAAAELAIRTADAVWSIKTAPDTLLTSTYESRNSIRFAELSERAEYLSEDIRAKGTEYELAVSDAAAPEKLRGLHSTAHENVIRAYEASGTEVRKDLGDSITKAFRNVDDILASEDMEMSEANRRAVRILGHNGVEINRETIESIKYFDAKLTNAVSRMQPAMVMSMIRRGINPLNEDLDSLNDSIDRIIAEEGETPEDRYSSFLVKMEEAGDITENERAAYIGIYRLLYRIETRDGAALGAALRSDKKLTLRNLLTEVRSERASGIDTVIDDRAEGAHSSYVNSVTEQIDDAFSYNMAYVRRIGALTDPKVWHEGLAGTDTSELSLEALSEKLNAADNMISTDRGAEAAAVRAVLSASENTKAFLKAFGVKRSVNNVNAMDDDDAPAYTKETLLDALTDDDSLNDSYGEALNGQAGDIRDMLRAGEPAEINALRASTLNGQLHRFGLLREVSENGHYRFSVDGEEKTNVNLTILRGTEDKGRIAIELERNGQTIRAELRVETVAPYGAAEGMERKALFGSVSVQDEETVQNIKGLFDGFLSATGAMGYEGGAVRLMVDRLGKEQYMNRLSGMKAEADSESTEGDTEVASTGELIRVARMFLERFL